MNFWRTRSRSLFTRCRSSAFWWSSASASLASSQRGSAGGMAVQRDSASAGLDVAKPQLPQQPARFARRRVGGEIANLRLQGRRIGEIGKPREVWKPGSGSGHDSEEAGLGCATLPPGDRRRPDSAWRRPRGAFRPGIVKRPRGAGAAAAFSGWPTAQLRSAPRALRSPARARSPAAIAASARISQALGSCVSSGSLIPRARSSNPSFASVVAELLKGTHRLKQLRFDFAPGRTGSQLAPADSNKHGG